MAQAAHADVSLSKSFLDANSFVQGVTENPVTTVNQGDIAILQITVLNSGNALTGGSVTDNLPAGMVIASPANTTFSAGCGTPSATATPGSSAYSYSSGQIPAQSGVTPGACRAYVRVRVIGPTNTSAGSIATLNNTLPANSFQGTIDGGPVSNTDPVTRSISVRKLAPLTVSKNFSPSSVVMGQTTIISIQIDNPNGGSPLDLTSIGENLPSNLTAVNTTPQVLCSAGGSPTSATNASASGTTGNTTIAFPANTRIAGGGSCTVTWTVRANAGNGAYSSELNTVPASSVQNDRLLTSNQAQAGLDRYSPLYAGKGFSPSVVRANQDTTLTFTLQNRSGFTLQNVAFTDNLPAGMTVSAVTPDSNCTGGSVTTPTSSQITATGISIAAGVYCTIQATVRVNNDGTYPNTTTAPSFTSLDPNVPGTRTTDAASATLTAYDQVTAAKSALEPDTGNGAASVAPGNRLRYVVYINNYTNAVLSNVAVNDPLPLASGAQVRFLSSPAPVFNNCTGTVASSNNAASAQFTGITIPDGSGANPSTCSITFTVQLPDNWPLNTAVTNTIPATNITQSGSPFLQGGDPSVTTPFTNRLSISKSVSPASVFQGDDARVTLVLNNDNYAPVTALSLTDSPVFGGGAPAPVELATPVDASTTCTGAPVFTGVAGGTSLSVSGLTLPRRGSCTISFGVRGITPGNYTNSVPASNVSGTVDSGLGNTSISPDSPASTGLTVTPVISASKSFGTNPVAANGGRSRVSISLRNLGTSALTNVAVNDPLPTGLILGNPVNASTTCAGPAVITGSAGGNSLTLAGATVPPGTTCLLQFDTITNGAASGSLTNAIPAGNITADNDVATVTAVNGTLNLTPTSGVAVSKTFSPTALTSPGEPSRLVVTVDNTLPGSINLTNLGLVDTLPTGSALLPDANTSTNCRGGVVTTQGNSVLRLAGAALDANQSCQFAADVTMLVSGSVTNVLPAGIVTNNESSTNSLPFSANLSAVATMGVQKFFSPTAVAPNTPARLTVRLINPFPLSLTVLAFTDNLPSGLVPASPAAAGSTCGGTVSSTSTQVSFSGGTLAPAGGGNTGYCDVSLNVLASAAGTYTNTIASGAATARDSNGNAVTNPAPASAELQVRSGVTLSKSFANANRLVNQPNRLTITITNPNTIALNNAVLTDNLPANVFLSDAPNGSTTCSASAGSTVSVGPGTPGAGFVRLTGAQIPANGSCSFSVDVLSNAVGVWVNTIPSDALVTDEGITNAAPATATFTTLEPPTLGKSFNPVLIGSGGTSSLRIVLGNSNAVAISMTSTLTDNLPNSPGTLSVTGIDSVSVDPLPRCANISSTATSVSVGSGTSIPAGGCVVIATVSGTVDGNYTNTIPGSALNTTAGPNPMPATAGLLITSTLAAISGTVYRDHNNDGAVDATDTPISGQLIQLLDSGGSVVATATTNSLGQYAFLGIAPGTYSVRQPNQPVGTFNGQTTVGTGATVAGAASGVGSTPSQFTGIQVAGGQSARNYNFGEVVPSSISGEVFSDADNNGLRGGSDAAIAGVTLTLSGVTDTGVTVSQSTTTAADGSYSFTNLRPGNYTVTEGAQPAGTVNGITTAGSVLRNGSLSAAAGGASGTATGVTTLVNPPSQTSRIGSGGSGAGAGSIVLPPNANSPGNNFAELPSTRSLSGRLYLDNNNDAIANGPDAGQNGYTITLSGIDINGNSVSGTTTTAADGSYSFANLPAGTYAVSYDPTPNGATVVSGRSLAGSTGGSGGTSASSTPTHLQVTGISLTGPNPVSSANDFTLVPRKVDVVKSAGVPLQVTPKSFRVPYKIVVGNASSVALANVQAADALRATFPAAASLAIVPGSFNAAGTGSAAQCAGPSTAYDGTTQYNLLAGNFGLAAGERCVVQFIVLVDFGSNAVPVIAQNNTVYASSASSANAGPSFNAGSGAFVADPSNALSTDISVNQALTPGAPGAIPTTTPSLPAYPGADAPSGVPTPVNFSGQVLDIIKNVGAPLQAVPSATGRVRFEVPYTVVVRNSGAVPATNVQAVDRVAAAFVAGAPVFSIKAGSFAVNNSAPNAAACAAPAGAFDGDASIALLAGNFDLAAGAQCTIVFTAVVEYANAAAVPNSDNQNVAFAVSSFNANPTGGSVTGSGSAAAFTPAPAASYIAIDSSSGNTVVMGAGANGATTYATSGGQSGTTGPTVTPSASIGNQQLPATAGADNGNSPPAVVRFIAQKIDVIKAVGVPRPVAAKRFEIPYTLVVQNKTSVVATNVQVMDNLARTFNPAGTPGIVITSTAPTITGGFDAPASAAAACTAASPAYTGLAQQALLAGNENLLPGQKCVMSLVVTVDWGGNPLPGGTLDNQAFASTAAAAQTPGTAGVATIPNDPSQSPVYPASALATDASTNVVPTSTAQPGMPPTLASLPPVDSAAAPAVTPVSVVPVHLDVVKSLTGPAQVIDARTFDVGYVVTLANTGTVPAYNVQLNDYLRGTFVLPAGNLPTLTNGGNGAALIAVTRTGGSAASCSPAGTFNGNASTALLAGTDNFAAGESCTVAFTVRVQYAAPADVPNGTAQDNFAWASSTPSGSGINAGYTFPGGVATAPTNVVASDQSTNGTALPGSANGDAASPTPVTLSSGPDLVVRKTHSPATFTERNRGTYTIIVSNRGYLPTSGAYNIVDTLPAGFTVASLPTGTGWDCAASVPGSTVARCTSSTVIAPGGGTVIDNPNAIVLTVNVAPGACSAANAQGQCFGPNSPVNTVAVSGGGEQNIAFFTGNNSFADPTPLQQSGGISGQVWFDANHDRLNGGENPVPGIVVEVLDASGAVVASATSDNSGNYTVVGLVPGPGYQVRFRDPVTGGYYGRPVSRDPSGGNDPTAGSSGVVSNNLLQNVVVPGSNQQRLNQSLPLDPSGVVYDSITRAPVSGATVELLDTNGNLVNASCVVGGVNRIVTAVRGNALDGTYSFLLLNPVPSGCPGAADYRLRVTPPSGLVASTTLLPQTNSLQPPAGCVNAAAGSVCAVQQQNRAPTGTQPTPWYTTLRLNPVAGPDVVNNHIPLDPAVLPRLFITKVGDRSEAELGDPLRYTIRVRRTDNGAGALNSFQLADWLPAGFRYIAGTATVNGQPMADPVGAPGPSLTFSVAPPGGLVAGSEATLTYRVRLGVGSQQGSGINRAQARLGGAALCASNPATCSNEALFRVRVTAGVFSNESCIVGKVFVDCNNNHVQDKEELGIPGVRMYLEDGTYLISDSEGKYSYCGLPSYTHVLKADPLTLPKGARLTTSSNRNAGDPGSLFLDLKGGELHRADFIEGSCSNTVLEQVKARRASGEVRSNENERKGRGPLKFQGKAADYPQEGTDSANQIVVKPRAADAASHQPATGASHENDVPVPELPAASHATQPGVAP